MELFVETHVRSQDHQKRAQQFVDNCAQHFMVLLCLLNWKWWLLFFIFKRPIIIGWGRDTGMILWPIRNSIWICGWRLDRRVDPIKIRFTGSPTLGPTACRRLVLLQPSGAPNQYRAPNLRSLWPCIKGATTYQRRTHNSNNSKEWRTNNSKNNKE